MKERYLYEYAVVRIVPRVEREEFLNVGIILYCAPLKFLKAALVIDEKRLSVFPDLDLHELGLYFKSMDHICNGNLEGGPMAAFPPASRFRWLTATRSTIIQMSKVHPGLCRNPESQLEQLFRQLVL